MASGTFFRIRHKSLNFKGISVDYEW
jgi:hypothetical protein